MNPMDVCNYSGSCLDCVNEENVFVETIRGILCCLADLGTSDDPAKMIARAPSDCPVRPMPTAPYFWGAGLALFGCCIGFIVWICTRKREDATARPCGEEDIPLVAYVSESGSIDSFNEATYNTVPTTSVHEGLRTYINVPLE